MNLLKIASKCIRLGKDEDTASNPAKRVEFVRLATLVLKDFAAFLESTGHATELVRNPFTGEASLMSGKHSVWVHAVHGLTMNGRKRPWRMLRDLAA